MAHFRFFPLGATLLLAAACSQPAIKPVEPVPQPAHARAEPVPVEAVPAEAALPKQPLTPDILFKFLIAEVAGQRGQIALAQSAYLDLARQTRDPRIARRAAEVSMYARDQAGALEAAQLWATGERGSARAQQTLAALLLNEGRVDEAEPILRALLREDPANGFMHLSALTGKMRDAQAALQLVERLAADHPSLPEAQFAIAQAAVASGRADMARAALARADALRPGWEPGALLHAQILGKTSPAEAMAFMQEFLAAHTAARDVRLAYARTLVNANRFAEARVEFTRLIGEFPRNPEVTFAAGLLSLQMGDLDAARSLLTQTLDYEPREPSVIQYYLGQVAEQMKQPETAASHYAAVSGGNYLVAARARQAALLAQAGRLDEGRRLLSSTRGENDAQNVRLIQAESELLRGATAYAAAFDVLDAGIVRFPDSAELLYDRAMVAERLDRLDVLEADLRRVIVLRPDDAQAYNALGYTLADRTDRLAEATVLLDRALALAPDDPFILDSVGWAHYRSGNLARAQEFLERAYRARPDPEIAAHLGEVLWARGRRDEAGSLWQSSLQNHPRNEVLLETLRRLKP